ncbi:MAG: tetratricopeptide repeat protein, partial [Methylococcales bacterium]|nr:tetratricopeptide repeat protein [Methylococcales bacterium]
MANALLRCGDYPTAEKEYKFILSRPELLKYGKLEATGTYSNLSFIYIMERQYRKAEDAYLQALKFIPDSPHLYVNLANCSILQGQYDKALDYINRAKKIDPRFPP